MGAKCTRTDFEWTTDKEPHSLRRNEILAKYPQIKQLFGPDAGLKYRIAALVVFQVLSLPLLSRLWWPYRILAAYCVGGVINHALMLAVHEIAHNLAFGHKRPLANRLLGMFANLPIAIPMSISFRHYHLEHHKFQGDEILDTDIPTALEASLFNTTGGKLLWLTLQPFFYALRPLVQNPKPPSNLELLNVVVQLTFNYWVWHTFGIGSLLYLLGGSLLAMGLHPVAGHFISEHYMFRHGFETYSYYGLLNLLTFNVGYHNEHHDFPYIAGSKLPQVRSIAADFYDKLPYHESWVRVLYDFVTDPAIGLYARIKRKHFKAI